MRDTDIAILGLAGRYPRCSSPKELFDALVEGKDLATDAPLSSGGRIMRHFAMEAVDRFDHGFFGYTPYEAMVMDPQHRVLLTQAYRAIEDAGYERFPEGLRVGVFASCSFSTYLLNNILRSRYFDPAELNYKVLLGNDKDTLATRISYKLNLTGPAITIQSACSSSLVATHFACQSLLSGDCDIAIVGAASITVPQDGGYAYKDGMILAKDGVCRPFDQDATGTIKGNGCSVVVLRRAADALEAKDTIRAIIRGTAVNNDGSDKIGFTAPGIRGQSAVIEEAHAFAGIEGADIDYIETHGTGTRLGDQIELTALARSIPEQGRKIPLGALKANLGHLDVAAGLTSVIKAVLMLESGIVPPIGNLRLANAGVPAATERFSFPTEAHAADLRTVAISAFGIGGTNAHAIVRRHEAGPAPADPPSLPYYLVPLSVDAPESWDAYRRAVLASLDAGAPLLDLAATLAARRRRRALTACLLVRNAEDLALQLAALETPTGSAEAAPVELTLAEADAVSRLWPLRASAELSQAPFPDRLARLGVRERFETVAARPAPLVTLQMLLAGLAKLYCAGAIDLSPLYESTGWRPVPLPAYPLQEVSHWIEPKAEPAASVGATSAAASSVDAELPAEPELIERILDVWQEFIGGERPAADTCFVDTGADSFTAIEVIDRLNGLFGCQIEIDSKVATLTASDLAQEILGVSRAATPWITYAKLGSQDARTLFLVHPAGGSTYGYSRLGRLLRSDISVCSLDLPKSYQGYASMTALASAYRRAILERHQGGPLLIGGYSFGGNVAHEMACQLQRDGVEVEAVVMFDSHPPEVYNTFADSNFDYVGAFPAMMASYFKPALLDAMERQRVDTLPDAIAVARRAGVLDTRLTDDDLTAFFQRWVFSHGLLKAHAPSDVARTNLLLFEASEPEPQSLFDRLRMNRTAKRAWAPYFTGVHTYQPAPGDHFTMFSNAENLKRLALAFDERVQAAGWTPRPAVAALALN